MPVGVRNDLPVQPMELLKFNDMLFVDLKIDGGEKKKYGEKYRIRSDSELIKTGILPGEQNS